jgi:hypothetical protein
MLRKMLFALGGCIALAPLAQAANTPIVTVPNTFVAGTPAKAADVNANFTALATAINNAVMPIVVTDSTGKVIGPYMPLFFGGANNGEGVFLRTSTLSFGVQVTSSGFTGPVTLLYTTADCSGSAYVLADGYSYNVIDTAFVMNNVAYVVQWAAHSDMSYQSMQTLNGSALQCAATSGAGLLAAVVGTVNLASLGYVPPFYVH